MGFWELVTKFCAGGIVVVIVSWLAKNNNPTLAGLFVLFPAITLVSFAFMLKDTSADAVKSATLSSIYYLPLTLVFLITFYFINKVIGGYWSLLVAICTWLIFAVLLMIINTKFLHI